MGFSCEVFQPEFYMKLIFYSLHGFHMSCPDFNCYIASIYKFLLHYTGIPGCNSEPGIPDSRESVERILAKPG
jgi:hypothetical protein